MGARGYDELMRQIQLTHGVRLGTEDPILVLHTINRALAEDLQQGVDRAIGGLKTDLEEAYFRWEHESKEKAERILSVALTKARDEVQTAATSAIRSAETTGALIQRLDARLRRFERLLPWLVAATGATLVVGGVSILVLLRLTLKA